MKTIGETLKGRRERLGMTLAELEERTQIKRDTLKLIEQNQFDKLALITQRVLFDVMRVW